MSEKKAEMSLDEVLSSIKNMVVSKEPPVLDLTDMVAEDGSIIKVDDSANDKNSMGAFLKLAQQSIENDRSERVSAETVQKGKNDYHALDSKGAVLNDIFQEIAAPIVQKWIQDNLPKLVSSLVEKELKKILKS